MSGQGSFKFRNLVIVGKYSRATVAVALINYRYWNCKPVCLTSSLPKSHVQYHIVTKFAGC